MPSFKATFFAVAAAFVATAAAQDDYVIEPDSVSEATRKRWCEDQRRSCPAICRQTTEGDPLVNDCDSDALRYGCICSDEKRPNMTQFSLTLPFHMCQEWGNQCVDACAFGDNGCASSCREDHPCGAQDPERVSASLSSTGSAPTASATGDDDRVYNGFAGSNDDDDDSDDDGDENSGNSGDTVAAASEVGRAMGFVVLAGSLFGGFALML